MKIEKCRCLGCPQAAGCLVPGAAQGIAVHPDTTSPFCHGSETLAELPERGQALEEHEAKAQWVIEAITVGQRKTTDAGLTPEPENRSNRKAG